MMVTAGPAIESIIYRFGTTASDGAQPTGSIIQASDGNFYGTTYTGGTYDVGTAFQVTPAGVETILYSFGASASDGSAGLNLRNPRPVEAPIFHQPLFRSCNFADVQSSNLVQELRGIRKR
jgi:uncharacterized repeat protein (TIGR03803 family)